MTVRRQIMPGDLVVHEYDRPRGKCVRLVTSVLPGRMVTYYLTAGHAPNLTGPIDADPEYLTRIELFGVQADRTGECAIAFRSTGQPSVATYHVEPRIARWWQGALPETITVRKRLLERWQRLMATTTEAA